MIDDPVKQAFLEVRQGRSPEYVICDPLLNEQFLLAARRLGVDDSDAAINTRLINLRKQKELKEFPTTCRKPRDPKRDRYVNAVLNAARMVERQFRKNVDDVICDPIARAQFDAIIQFLSPGISPFEAQYVALSLRKTNQLKPEPVGQVIRAVESRALALSDLEARIRDIPNKPGVYIFFDQNTTMYAGKADNLRARITAHVSTWTFREMIREIRSERRPEAHVVFHQLPITISARELLAYETELIRSRQPEHNRSGIVPKTLEHE